MSHHRQVGMALLALLLAAACKPAQPPAETAAPVLRPAVQAETPPEFAAVNDPDLVKLKDALLVGTAEALIPYFEHPEVSAPGGRLSSYDQAYLRGESQGGTEPLKSVRDILKEEPVAVLAYRQPKGDWIVVFISESRQAALDSARFLGESWLTDYFACRVDRIDGKVRIVQNFCFNETDGPYPAD